MNNNKISIIFFIIIILLFACNNKDLNDNNPINTETSGKATDIYSIAFYNMENLFDTNRDLSINDEEFTPDSPKKWNEDKYKKKLNNLSYVINEIEKESQTNGLIFIGISEVENKKVLEDLVSHKNIKESNYQIVHYDSPDVRGIDVGLLYNPLLFKVISSKTYNYNNPKYPNFRTRDILYVCGTTFNDTLHILVNHWPSRKGENNLELRDYAAKQCKNISDSIIRLNINAKVIIMGDLNDNPADRSCRVILKAKKDKKQTKPGELFNPMWQTHDKGIGTARYQNNWDLFDQIIISESFLNQDLYGLKYNKSEVFNKDFLIQKSGKYKGYPLRTFSGNVFLNGYSDHFPVILYLEK